MAQVVHLSQEVRGREREKVGATVRALPRVGKWLFLADVLALLAAFVGGGLTTWAVTLFVGDNGFQGVMTFATLQQLAIFMGLGIFSLLWLDMKGHYRQRLPFWEIMGNVLAVAGVGLAVGGFIQFAMKGNYSRLWFAASWILFAIFLPIVRAHLKKALRDLGCWEIPSLMIGSGRTSKAGIRAIESEPGMGYRITKVIPPEMLEKLVTPQEWRRFMIEQDASYLFLALEDGEVERYRASLKAMTRERLPYSMLPPWSGLALSGLSSHHFMLHDVMMMHDTNRLQLPLPRLLKRTFDILVSGTALILLSPVFATVSFLVRRDGGKAFFIQPRIGAGGQMFPCYKFRSMCEDAESTLRLFLENNKQAAAEWTTFQKLKQDPRITGVGDFIRRTSIDELPQLINVLKGDMSLVGPRPIMSGQESFYGDDFIYYKSARPGITGPWQVSGRNQLTIQQRVALEAWYVRNWSLWMDIVLIMKTFPALLKRDTAF